MELLRKTFITLLKNTESKFERKLPINWDNKMIAITGARGVGKTTFLLQHIKNSHKDLSQVLYVSLDNLYFYENPLIELVDEFYDYGGRYLYLDEVHKYTHWSSSLKNIYDNYPEIKVVFTSSSILDIYKGDSDLSRRAIKYAMHGLSFREYLLYRYQIGLNEFSLQDILFRQEQLALNLPKDFFPLSYFNAYLKDGYFPFGKEPDFLQKLMNAINNVIESDLGKIENLSQNKIEQVKRVLGVIAESAPFKPNISSLSNKLQINRDIILTILFQLERGRILNLLRPSNSGVSILQKPDKIYLENTNLMHALKIRPDLGNIRETFFYNQMLNAGFTVNTNKQADFLVNNKYSFEIGGRDKKRAQIQGLDNAFVVKDDIAFGSGNIIPIWMFGMMY
ncbi:MAG: AAA family ATPase [Cyclobacteriaceae bacterium]